MKKVRFSDTDLYVSRILLGTGNFKAKLSKEAAFDVMSSYVEAGGNFIDTANFYCRWLPDTDNCAEQFIGEWLRKEGHRKDVVIATKGGHPHALTGRWRADREHITEDLEESLRTLGVDCVDLYWFHRDNKDLPIEERGTVLFSPFCYNPQRQGDGSLSPLMLIP